VRDDDRHLLLWLSFFSSATVANLGVDASRIVEGMSDRRLIIGVRWPRAALAPELARPVSHGRSGHPLEQLNA
jgi:hypothetical protein